MAKAKKNSSVIRKVRRERIKARIRRHLFGMPERPRLCVFRSHRFFYIQAVDDCSGKTLLGMNSKKVEKCRVNQERAFTFGKVFGSQMVKKGIKACVFDRSGYLYHGRIRKFVDGVREAGVKI